jgi:predicted transcriptional regulator YheO
MGKLSRTDKANGQRRAKKREPVKPLSSEAKVKLDLLADLVPKLARAFAPICEVVLHENSTFPPTIKAIGNGHVSGRAAGDSMIWSCQIFVDGTDAQNRKTPIFNYPAQLPNGKKLRASLIPIVHDDEVIAYMTVSILVQDIAIAQQALSLLIEPEPSIEAAEESFVSPRDLVTKIIDSHLRKSSRPIAMWDRKQRIELIRELKDRGVFITRGAVDEVASMLGVSRTAVYNYLNDLDQRASTK